MAANCPTVGKSSVQRVFVEIENISGELQKPTPQGFIAPAGKASLTQTPGYADSEELTESLNIIDQFQNAVEPGTVSLPMYLRLPKDGTKMQGHALVLAGMGSVQDRNTATAELKSDAEIADTELTVIKVSGGILPMRGIISVGTEKIMYLGVTKQAADTKLTGCVRGYAGTAAVKHITGAITTLSSRVYMQAICRPTTSIWLQVDHTVVFGSGGVVTQLEVPMSNTGGQKITASLQFRRMGWAGRSFVDGPPSGGMVMVSTGDGKNAAQGYTVGAYIKNTTQADSNNDAGYRIAAVDAIAGTITVTPAPVGWADGDQIDAWLPEAPPIGIAIESRDARVFIDNASGKLTEGSITLGTPTAFTSEIGDEYPGENADTKRSLTIGTNMYMRAKDVVEIGKGYQGYEVPMAVVLGGKSGASLALAMPRVKLNTPTIGENADFVTLERTGAIMGTSGEDALYIIHD